MSKAKKTATATKVRTPKSEPAAPAAKAAAPVKTITVAKKEEKYDGARGSWYAALIAHDGQSVDTFVEACTKTPPALPKSGKAENPRGWLNWFVRAGVATLS